MEQIVTNRTDDDLYKFSMAQAVFHNYTDAWARYEFTCRAKDLDLSAHLLEIKEQIYAMNGMGFDGVTLLKMGKKLPFLKSDFLHYLNNSKLNTGFVDIYNSNSNGGIDIVIEGPWLDTIWFEVHILSIISEIYVRDQLVKLGISMDQAIENAKKRYEEKIRNAMKKYDLLTYPNFADFGTRRRASLALQREMLSFLKNHSFKLCVGTSNVMLGLENDMKIIGTMAHEWIMAHAGFTRFDLSQKMALNVWQKEYRDQLGIALTDTYTTDFFLKDFDGLLAKSYSGVRQDSGNPIEVGYKFIRHYENLGIDPMTKQIVFSDSLNFDKIVMLQKQFKDKIQTGFGIGTNLMNDIGFNVKPLNAVIKMTAIKYGNDIWYPTIKLSDSLGKSMCKDKEYSEFIQKVVRTKVEKE